MKTFTENDMKNFAAKCMLLGHQGKTLEELLADFVKYDL